MQRSDEYLESDTVAKLCDSVNPFHATDLFWYPLKTSENHWFSDVFGGGRGVSKEISSKKWVKREAISQNLKYKIYFNKFHFTFDTSYMPVFFSFSNLMSCGRLFYLDTSNVLLPWPLKIPNILERFLSLTRSRKTETCSYLMSKRKVASWDIS